MHTLKLHKVNLFKALYILLILVLVTACHKSDGQKKYVPGERLDGFTTTKQYPGKVADESIKDWKKKIPEIEQVSITSTKDGKKQPALFYASTSTKKKPLLVVLHSWSSEYLQVVSIPYALWAKLNDWVFIQPNYRGAFKTPDAMASDLAIQDIMDAVHFAKGSADIDPSRIYIVGSSGGAMTALVTASKHPDVWAGVVAWVPVFDLVDWYKFSQNYPHRDYNRHIVAACGGEPIPGTAAAEECKRRSPSTYLHNLKGIPVFLAHGTIDVLVPPDHSIRAFNMLVDSAAQIPQWQMDSLVINKEVPKEMTSDGPSKYFGPKDPKLLYTKKAGVVDLFLYYGVHDMAYNPSLLWLNEQQKKINQ
ncbi:prolyl oligopeptidase family serine peptidase [Pontibacter sp. H259]|uniref:alpha/beta hydrolase family protein n=1 Tax=Pontibacter sp. H259 TaxID=3133421 RepID=UPI0030BFF5A0